MLIIASTLLRAWVASRSGLSVDEAHYALYGVHLDWSYFDHPPLIGWLQALVLPFGDSNLAMRMLPMVLFAATALVLYRVTQVLFPHATSWLGFTSVALLHSGLMFQLIGMSMLPDTPLLLLGLLVLWVLHSVFIQGREQHWLWFGVLLGLAALAKYTAITLLVTVLLALLLSRQWRQLRSPWPWLAMVISGLLIYPILYWNYHHEWISFLYQLHHGTRNPSWEISRFLRSQAAQLVVYGPGLYVFGLLAMFSALNWRGTRDHERDHSVWLCLTLALPVLLLFGWGAGYELTLPHWVSLAWAGLTPLTAYWLHRHWPSFWVRTGVKISLVYALVLIALVFAELITPRLPLKENNHLFKDLYGWPQAAQRAEYWRTQMSLEAGVEPLLFTGNWSYASRLAWYARPTPVQVIDARYDQFDIWFGAPQNGARGILLVWPEAVSPATGGAGQFARCELREILPIRAQERTLSTFAMYACDGFKN